MEIVATCRANRGETWDMVAFREMGNEYYAQELIEANPAYHGTVIFEGAELLNIPLVGEEAGQYQAPWRRA